jgi:predicted small metal-binding protein
MAQQFECYQEGCEFMVRADTSEEVVALVQQHAKDVHGLELAAEDIQSEVESA